MLLPGQFINFVFEHFETADEFFAGFGRNDHFVDKAAVSCTIGIGKFGSVLVDFFLELGFRILGICDLFFEDDLCGALRSHDCYFSGRPSEV